MKYHIFNPESDFALALGRLHYCAPQSLVRFREDLSLLPLWFAEAEDLVVVKGDVPADWMQSERAGLGVTAEWVNAAQFIKKDDIKIQPWGWNHSLCEEWKVKNIDCDKLRELSGRSVSIRLLSFLQQKGFLFCKDFVHPVEVWSEAELIPFLTENHRVILKLPWSSSGKGLKVVENGCLDEVAKKWFANGVKRQGYFMCEKFYQKKVDFAMEFFCGAEYSQFAGYSLFQTQNGKYAGNILMSDDAIEKHLTSIGGSEVEAKLTDLKKWIAEFLDHFVQPYYQGFVGVDMMMIEAAGGVHVHPCVELNLRMNMGCVSRIIYDRYVLNGQKGVFNVVSCRSHAELVEFHEEKKKNNPLKIQNKKITSGYLPLTYIQEDSLSMAYISIN